ncbi:cyclin-like protein [Nitzschia inconspicua]|uniref:Cyclin-like protein n=1 Tax=Nitzschia inconspicua TaxID=303405 RepID=A0A9K3PWH5_9STRA|nr:cyclin-like protein [Nitzschia inconspicua]
MLKLTMNPRKRSKRMRAYFAKLRQLGSQGMAEMEGKAMEQREAISENVQSLLNQQHSGDYDCVDYLSLKVWSKNVYDLLPHCRLKHMQHPGDSRVDEFCREQIVEWSFRVVDYFRIDREVVAVSISLLDRFLAQCECDRSTFKLAATTTLHLAVKLLHPYKLGELGILSDLSRGEFDMKDVACMERHILQCLQWKMHPPTPNAFSTLLLDFIFSHQSLNLSSTDVDDLYDISSFFTELSLCDYYFVGIAPSSIALASVVNALEGMFGPENKVAPLILAAASKLQIFTNQDLSTASHRLWELYERSEECALHNSFDPMEEEKVSDSAAAEIFANKQPQNSCNSTSSSPVSVQQQNPQQSSSLLPQQHQHHSSSMTSKELMCAMRSQALRKGSW